MVGENAGSDVSAAVMEHIHAYREKRHTTVGTSWSDKVQAASRAQSRAGYRSMAEGCLVREW